METQAIVLFGPKRLSVEPVSLVDPGKDDVVVEVHHTGISAGTERLLWDGAMPDFPGMGYPLVPGYETVGRVIDGPSGAGGGLTVGDPVFVPGARCYRTLRPLFGGASRLLHAPRARLHRIDSAGPDATLMALAATAHHAIAVGGLPDLVIGHGVLGQLVSRIAFALGGSAPRVHEVCAARRTTAHTVDPADDPRRDYPAIIDASGDPNVLDTAIARLARGGKLTLAGFYGERLSFAFPPAFMREARFAIAAEWKPADVEAVRRLLDAGSLSFEGLVTHSAAVSDAEAAYATAFDDPACLKMTLNWRDA